MLKVNVRYFLMKIHKTLGLSGVWIELKKAKSKVLEFLNVGYRESPTYITSMQNSQNSQGQ